jgi:hypothetical protein
MFLIIGYILALTVHAQFEAWMFSPGGALPPAFWTASGMLTQLSYEVLGARSTKSIRSYPSRFGQSTLPETRFIGVRHNV